MAKNVGEISLDAREITSKLIVKVRMPRMWSARLWLAVKLVWLAGAVSGFRADVEIEGSAPE